MTLDIPSAFLQTETHEYVIMVLKGQLAELMANLESGGWSVAPTVIEGP